nr:hypothetical protein [Tanacetum cinerariifolium]
LSNKEGLVYNVVPPPPAQVYTPPKKDMSWTGLPEFKDDIVNDYSRPSPAIESTSDNAQNKNPSDTETEASPSTISPKPFIKFVKATDRSIETKTAKVETAKPAVKYAAMYSKPSKSFKGSSQNNIEDKGYWDNGCSRHMTGNISYLSEYEPFDGGYVSFGQEGCKITGKGTIKTECIVLGQNFKLLNDANVLLRTPRQHNMYSIDLNSIVSHKDLTCLVAKASTDKGMIWNMRLGHLNFKTMNWLVRYNLVRGLPSKCFENDHNCTACLKGKQHKASWIKREFSNARTPQQNGVAERRNKTLIEAARTMLADAKLPVTFWAKAVNTAWKFEAKGDEGYFIGYSMSSKAFRVFNKRTKRVEENLHVDFLENKAIEKGIKDAASQEVKKDVSSLRYIALPNWIHEVHLESSSSQPQETCNSDEPESSGNSNPTATSTNPSADQLETITVETPIPTISSPVPTACLNDSPEPSDTRLILKRVANQLETPSLDNILTLTNRFEDILGVTTNSDESNRVEADVSTMEPSITASPTSTLRIHKDHPKSQIIGPVDTLIQTKNKSKELREQIEPKNISDALQDPSWVEAMQEELLQFKIQNVWTLVDCPKGVRPIRTKWVLKNKKNEKGIDIRNKPRLVAQRHTQEEGIDYDKVFAHVARIKDIRLFLAYALFMGFTVYQMDVKSTFLYGTIDEEVYVMQPPGFQDSKYPARVYKVEKAMYGLL